MPRAEGIPQTYDAIVEAGRNKAQTSRLYSGKRQDENDQKISELVTASIADLTDAATAMDTVSLSDTPLVQTRTLLYVRACADARIIPSFSGLMRSLGKTSQAGYNFLKRKPEHESSRWLSLFQDYCGDILADAALKGLTHPIFSIFVEKSRNQWKDVVTVESAAYSYDSEDRLTAEGIIRKYQNLPEE